MWYLPPLSAGSVCTWWASRAGTRCPHARWRTETETTQVSSSRRSQSAVSYPSQTSRNILYKNSEKLHGIFFTRIVRNMFFPFLIWVQHKKCLYSFQSLRLSFLLYSLFNNEDMCIVLTIPWLLTAHKDKSLLSLLVHSFSPIVTSQTYFIPATTYKTS